MALMDQFMPKWQSHRDELRDIWLSEASDFTPWLARKENLAILGETFGIDLELEAQERPVGPFRADILCKEIGTDRWVLIENQLERNLELEAQERPVGPFRADILL
jgi:hypothetical protein